LCRGLKNSIIKFSKIDISNLSNPPEGSYWMFVKTRPEGEAVERKLEKTQGLLLLPDDIEWDECELKHAKTGRPD